jgi:mono/diheme cytochrome c family protein
MQTLRKSRLFRRLCSARTHACRADTRVDARLALIALLILSPALFAQEPPAGGRGGRGGPALREFLGLGPAPDPVAAERGAKLYAPNCGFCHGDKAQGAGGPDLVRSTVVLHDEKGDLIAPLLRDGRPDKGMPAFAAMTPDQLSDIAQFLHLRVELTANRGTYKVLDIVTGDAKKGEAYFNGAGGCAACHSPTGDLAKISTRFVPDQLQNRFLWPGGGRGGGSARKVTVTLPSGEKVAGTLARIDDFTVDVTDASGARRSIDRDNNVKVDIEDRLVAHRQLLDKYTDADIHNLTAYLVTLK